MRFVAGAREKRSALQTLSLNFRRPRALGRTPTSAKSALSEIMADIIMMTCTVLVTTVVLMHAELFISSPTQALSGVEEVQNLAAQ
jgi:hypothetical protein